MKKICNFRIIPAIFLVMILGIISMYLMFYEIQYSNIHYLLDIYLSIAVIIFVFILIYRLKALHFILNNLTTIFILCLTMLITLTTSYTVFNSFSKLESMYDVKIETRVSDVTICNTYKMLECSEVKVNDESIKYNITMYVYDDSVDFSIGDKLSFTGDLVLSKMFDKGVNLYPYVNNTPYKVYNYTNLNVTAGNLYLDETVRDYVKDTLNNNMSKDSYTIAYGMLFGVKDEIDDSIYEAFSLSGIAHILAVSGLHISVLVMAIKFVLDKLKVRKGIYMSIIAVVLFVYMYLCGFTASIVRASIMALVVILSQMLSREYDAISSLSLSGVVYLLIYPMGLFSAGFQLSYLCVFAIITFVPSISKLFKLMHVPKVLGDTLAISIAVNLVILPISANIFDKVSLVGIFANILVLPIFNVVYVMLFMCTLLSIIPILRFLLILVDIGIGFIVKLALLFAQFELLILNMFNMPYITIFALLFTLLTIKYMLSTTKIKAIVVTILTICTVTLALQGFVPKTYNIDSLNVDYQYNSNVSIVTMDSKIVLVGCDINKQELSKLMKGYKISTIDYVIAYDIKGKDDLDVLDSYNIGTVYVPNNIQLNGVEYKTAKLNKTTTIENMLIYTYGEDKVLGVEIEINNTNMLFLSKHLTKYETVEVMNAVTNNIDYLVCYKLNSNVLNNISYQIDTIITQTNLNFNDSTIIELNNEYKINPAI